MRLWSVSHKFVTHQFIVSMVSPENRISSLRGRRPTMGMEDPDPGTKPRRSRHRNALINASLLQERANRPRTVPASAPRQAAPGGQGEARTESSAGDAATDMATVPSAPAPSLPASAPTVVKAEDAGKDARAAEALEAPAAHASARAGRLLWCPRSTGAEARPATAVTPGDGRRLVLHCAHRPHTAGAAAGGQRRMLRLRGGYSHKPSPRPGRDLLTNNRPQTGRAVPALSEERQRQREAVQRWRLEKQERDAQEAALREQKAREAAEAWALRARACRAQLLLLKSQSATNTKPAPAHVPRPPPEALVRLDRTREAHTLLREQFVADLSAVKGLDSIAIPVIPVVSAMCATGTLSCVFCAMWNIICRIERESRDTRRH